VSFSLGKGQILSLIGESGSGKTTLLRMIAGLEMPHSGQVFLQGRMVSGHMTWIPPEKRQIGMVFQDYALFPHLTVAQNIRFGLNRLPGSVQQQRVTEELARVKLPGYESRYPHELSGGEQQRIAIARALAPRPAILLFDEPFSNLDALTKEELVRDIPQIIREAGIPAIFVTHDVADALAISDQILILHKGHYIQYGTPEQVRTEPADAYVRRLMQTAGAAPDTTPIETLTGQVLTRRHTPAGEEVVLRITPVPEPET
jgi:iron(III) transport system ATP-binding protein